jgi:hypothetical protein
MKRTKIKIGLALAAALAGAGGAFAQSNGVPGPADYERFSHFVTDRNIFDPSRQPHSYSPTRRIYRTTRRASSVPGIMLVGTMSYEKGVFAFFNGNNADLKKALQAGEKIAGYTIAEISANRVQLESADKTQQIELEIGEGLRQENGKWVFSGANELPSGTSASTASAAGAPGAESPTPAAPSALESNDVLKRLMQLREKENQ